MSREFKILYLILMSIISLNTASSLPLEGSDLPQILVLHSYHQNYRWTADVTKGIQDILKEKAELHFEYMDTKKHTDPAYLDAFARMLEIKTEKVKYDLIISCDNYAFDFICEHRDRLYGTVPLVFCGVNFFEAPRLEGLSKVTGFSEENDFIGSLDLMRSVFPERKKLVCILDETLTGQATLKGLEKVLPLYEDLFESIEIWSHLSMVELLRDLALLDERFVVYYIYFQRDRLENYYEFHYSTKLIGEASGAPVFAAWDFQFSHGVIGGNLLQGVEQGQLAGEAVLQILEGASIDSFPLYRESPHTMIFDFKALKRYGLELKDLPGGSTVVNSPDSLFHRYRVQISLTLAIITILFLLVMILLTVVRKLRISERKISELNDSLNSKVKRRTEELEFTNSSLQDTLDKLQITQNELIRNERLSAIGSLVAGVSHEINTPLGDGITAASYMVNNLRDLEKDIKNDILTREELKNYLDTLKEGVKLISGNLKKTSALISSFKHLSPDERSGECLDFDLKEYLEEILVTHKNQFSERQITISLSGGQPEYKLLSGQFLSDHQPSVKELPDLRFR